MAGVLNLQSEHIKSVTDASIRVLLWTIINVCKALTWQFPIFSN